MEWWRGWAGGEGGEGGGTTEGGVLLRRKHTNEQWRKVGFEFNLSTRLKPRVVSQMLPDNSVHLPRLEFVSVHNSGVWGGAQEGKAGKGEAQVVEVSFLLRSAAKKEYTLFAMCDSWIACDVVLPLHLKVRLATNPLLL